MQDILYLVDDKGTIQSVQLSAALWKKVESLVTPFLASSSTDSPKELVQKQGPLNDFHTLLQFWDFSYPYTPSVSCPVCGAKTEDWIEDKEHKFILTNANLGGLLVFHCKQCGTTIRQKHFKDHIAYEHSKKIKTE